ncbi:MAG: tetratricopeptide repeat protein [Myxococcota bacterium]
MSTPREWELLQERFARGEKLSPNEESQRRQLAAADPIAQRELAFFDRLANQEVEPDASRCAAIAERALAEVRGLHLVGEATAATQREAARCRWARPTAAAFAMAVAASFAWWRLRPQPVAVSPSHPAVRGPAISAGPSRSELVFASGELLVNGRSASAGKQLLQQGTVLETRSGRACLTIDPNIDVCLDRQSKLAVTSLQEPNIELRVLSGSVAAALSARTSGQGFSLLLGDERATARGTAFALNFDATSGAKQLTVAEGKVELTLSNRSELVAAHTAFRWNGAATSRSVVGRNEEASVLALLAPRELWQAPNLGTLHVPAAEPGSRVLIGDVGPFDLPLTTFVPAKRHQLLLLAGGSETTLNASVEAGQETLLAISEPKAASSSKAQPAAATRSAAELLDEAREKLRRNDTRGAAAAYERLVALHPHSSEASTVQVTLGKLQLALGAPARALAAFDRYLGGGGPLAPEALAGKIRALRALGKTEAERAAIHVYLSRYPGGFDAEALRARAAALSDK